MACTGALDSPNPTVCTVNILGEPPSRHLIWTVPSWALRSVQILHISLSADAAGLDINRCEVSYPRHLLYFHNRLKAEGCMIRLSHAGSSRLWGTFLGTNFKQRVFPPLTAAFVPCFQRRQLIPTTPLDVLPEHASGFVPGRSEQLRRCICRSSPYLASVTQLALGLGTYSVS